MPSVITVRVGATADSSHEDLRLELQQATGLDWTLGRSDGAGTLGGESFLIASVVGGAVGGAFEEVTKQLIDLVRARVKEWAGQYIDQPPVAVEVDDAPVDLAPAPEPSVGRGQDDEPDEPADAGR